MLKRGVRVAERIVAIPRGIVTIVAGVVTVRIGHATMACGYDQVSPALCTMMPSLVWPKQAIATERGRIGTLAGDIRTIAHCAAPIAATIDTKARWSDTLLREMVALPSENGSKAAAICIGRAAIVPIAHAILKIPPVVVWKVHCIGTDRPAIATPRRAIAHGAVCFVRSRAACKLLQATLIGMRPRSRGAGDGRVIEEDSIANEPTYY